jgi:hypothetical protein
MMGKILHWLKERIKHWAKHATSVPHVLQRIVFLNTIINSIYTVRQSVLLLKTLFLVCLIFSFG